MHSLVTAEGITVADVRCSHRRGEGLPDEQTVGHALVFVRRGQFVRQADGETQILDPTMAYCMNPGEEQRYDHPNDHGDDCTALLMTPEVAAAVWGGDPELPRVALPTAPQLDLAHRVLLADARRSTDRHALVERAHSLIATVLERHDQARALSGHRSSDARRRTMVSDAREALAANLDLSLTELARELAISPHHLSRTFRRVTGETIARHRMRLRARAALERLAEGERDLGWLAADLGFADHSHLCRVLRSETGRTPSALRAALRPS